MRPNPLDLDLRVSGWDVCTPKGAFPGLCWRTYWCLLIPESNVGLAVTPLMNPPLVVFN